MTDMLNLSFLICSHNKDMPNDMQGPMLDDKSNLKSDLSAKVKKMLSMISPEEKEIIKMMVMPEMLAPDAQRLLKILKVMSPEELNDVFSDSK